MTYFNVRIPGLGLRVVQADGQNVQPVDVDEFQIAVAETYDVIVTPKEDKAFTIFAEAIDGSGYARGTLAPRPGMTAEIPPMRPPPRHHGRYGHGYEQDGHERHGLDERRVHEKRRHGEELHGPYEDGSWIIEP